MTNCTRDLERSRGRTQHPSDGRTVIRFADTMVMSTYLVAFVVGRLEMTEAVDVDGTPLRVVHVPGKGHLTAFALDVGAFCLRWFQTTTGSRTPATRSISSRSPISPPAPWRTSAASRSGRTCSSIDPATSTQNERQLVADVVAHELAHMWFGDLVTMRWWNGIWLNEAFATFMEVAALRGVPTGLGALDVVRGRAQRRLRHRLASLDPHRRVRRRSPADADGMFDVLTYQKGGALLRMLEQYLGEDRFRQGVSHYLDLHSYANTETNDLWDAIEETLG